MSVATRKNEPINRYHQVGPPSGSVAGVWTTFDGRLTGPITLEGVYWTGTVSNYFQLRDANSHVFYLLQSGSADVVNILTSPLTVQGPIQYFDSSGSATIRLFGRFV